jgi:hypothetical protein
LAAKKRGLYRFSDHFGISRSQSQLDFVDIPLDTDIRLFVDPYALHVSPVDWLRTCGDLVANYFELLIQTLKARDEAKALGLLSNLHEPNETRLGLSKGAPSGRGWGRVQAKQLYERLSKSKAVISGKLRDLGDFELLIPGIGSDKISDLAINVIRGELTTYTEEQCDLYGVPTENVPAGVFWNPDDQRWESHYANLPVYKDKGLILVPKIAVRRRLVPDYQEFYNYHILRFLEAEHLRAGDALVHTLKNGNPRVYKGDLRAKYKISKEFLFDFSEAHPAELRAYKKSLPNKAATPISDNAIEERQVSARSLDAHVTSQSLMAIAPGVAQANEYHNFILGALTEIFYPTLTRPKREQPVDDGRKRIDIFFHNSATEGFFSWLVNVHGYHAPYILIECKNYSDDPQNPEFDQLLGRLNRKRGFVGIMVCRAIKDRNLMLKRCQDVVNNNDKQLILVLEDKDISTMLDFVAANARGNISAYLEDALKEILT